jgi:hypothetical protein
LGHDDQARQFTLGAIFLMNKRSWNGRIFNQLMRGANRKETEMKTMIVALFAAALIVATPAVMAAGVSSKTPGHEMQLKGSKKSHPGASGYAPGREMQSKGSKRGAPGASGYAPGQTTGSSTKRSY